MEGRRKAGGGPGRRFGELPGDLPACSATILASCLATCACAAPVSQLFPRRIAAAISGPPPRDATPCRATSPGAPSGIWVVAVGFIGWCLVYSVVFVRLRSRFAGDARAVCAYGDIPADGRRVLAPLLGLWAARGIFPDRRTCPVACCGAAGLAVGGLLLCLTAVARPATCCRWPAPFPGWRWPRPGYLLSAVSGLLRAACWRAGLRAAGCCGLPAGGGLAALRPSGHASYLRPCGRGLDAEPGLRTAERRMA